MILFLNISMLFSLEKLQIFLSLQSKMAYSTAVFVIFLTIYGSAQPNVSWLTATGSSGRCEAISTSFDPTGNILVCGRFQGTINLNPLGTVFNLSSTSGASSNAFVAKYNSEGILLWAFRLGFTGPVNPNVTFANAIRTDSGGNVIVSGIGRPGIDFDPSASTFIPFIPNQVLITTFLAKYDPDGNLLWAFQVATNHNLNLSVLETHNYGQRMSIDADDNIILTGAFEPRISGGITFLPDFDPGSGEAIPEIDGGLHLYLAKYSPEGNFLWYFALTSTTSTGSSFARGYSVATDDLGNIWLGGNCIGDIDIDPGPGEFILNNAPTGSSTILAKYDDSGNFIWGHMLLSNTLDQTSRMLGIAVDSENAIYICGRLRGEIDFDPGVEQVLLTSPSPLANSAYSIYLSKYTSSGILVWARLIEVDATGNTISQGQSIAVHPDGYIMFTGQFFGQATLSDGVSTIELNSAGGFGNSDAFLAAYTRDGQILWVTSWGGASSDSSHELAVHSSGEVSIAGHYQNSYDFNIDGLSFPLASSGNNDILLLKIIPAAPYRGGPADGFAENGPELTTLAGQSLYSGGTGQGFTESGLGAPFLEVPLPIELLYFHAEAEGDVVRTFWETATEINNDYFAVERSDDGYTWDDVGTLKGAGNSTSPQVYSLMDSAPLSGLSYYRLRQVDFDGTFAHSEIRAVFFDQTAGQSLMLYPNPTHREVTVHLNGIDADIETLSIFNLVGQELWKQHGQGQSIEKVDLSSLPSGTYLVQVQSADRVYRKKVVRL